MSQKVFVVMVRDEWHNYDGCCAVFSTKDKAEKYASWKLKAYIDVEEHSKYNFADFYDAYGTYFEEFEDNMGFYISISEEEIDSIEIKEGELQTKERRNTKPISRFDFDSDVESGSGSETGSETGSESESGDQDS